MHTIFVNISYLRYQLREKRERERLHDVSVIMSICLSVFSLVYISARHCVHLVLLFSFATSSFKSFMLKKKVKRKAAVLAGNVGDKLTMILVVKLRDF